MAYWHAVTEDTNSWVFPAKKGSRVAVSFRGRNARKAPFSGCFLRYEGAGEVPTGLFPHWRRSPEGWFELWPLEPMLAYSMEEAKLLFEPLLPQIEDGRLDAQFEKRPFQPPIVPQWVKEIEHITHVAMARIMRYPDGLYSVGYLVYAPNGRYLPASTPNVSTDWYSEWGVAYATDEAGQRLRTLADDLTSAEEIAVIELNRLVAQDPEIKHRR